MNAGTENRRKTIIAGSLVTLAVLAFGYVVYSNFFSYDAAPTPPPSIVSPAKPAAVVAPTGNAKPNAIVPSGNAAGVDAKVLARASTSLDPTLDESAMLRTEHLVYAGAGRNIFSALYTPPAPKLPKPIAPPRPKPCPPECPPPPPPPPPPPTCPPTCAPIPLKFFGTETLSSGVRQAFLLDGEDVYLAGPGDIIARKFKILSVGPNTVQVQDLSNTNTQTLPLQSN